MTEQEIEQWITDAKQLRKILNDIYKFCTETEEKLQKNCWHPDELVKKKHGANTGNYDGSDYWVDNHCGVCGKYWVSDRKHTCP